MILAYLYIYIYSVIYNIYVCVGQCVGIALASSYGPNHIPKHMCRLVAVVVFFQKQAISNRATRQIEGQEECPTNPKCTGAAELRFGPHLKRFSSSWSRWNMGKSIKQQEIG